jgi:hypothetical protein
LLRRGSIDVQGGAAAALATRLPVDVPPAAVAAEPGLSESFGPDQLPPSATPAPPAGDVRKRANG